MSAAKPKLRQLIKSGTFIVAPGIYDMISARIADTMGFHALYMTGYGVTASYLGLPDAGLATYTDMVGRARAIAEGTTTPLIADADTGYGGLLNVRHTVRGYEAAGVQGIQIEDQEMPKKCGHTPGRRVVPKDEMVQKIKVAVDSRRSEDTLIIARTDARTDHGLEAALERAQRYREAGADVIFVESPQSEAELAAIPPRFDAPCLANMVEGGRTPILSRAELEASGFKLAIFPTAGFLAAGAALRSVYGEIQSRGSSKAWSGELYPFDDFSRLMGFERVWAFEREHIEG